MERPLVLIVDDHPLICMTLEAVFRSMNWDVRLASGAVSAICVYKQGGKPKLVITDILMPDPAGYKDGLYLIRELIKMGNPTPIIAISAGDAVGNMGGLETAAELGRMHNLPIETLQKPLDTQALVRLVHRLCPPTTSSE